ncbi:MAG: hypothetical protein HQL97_01180 [Magnetococcales bacterium]|nr:hypothetical protein [Magnetococcales bacterium]
MSDLTRRETDVCLDAIWRSFGEWFGAAWTTHHGLADNGVWIRDLSDLKPYQIERGLHAVLESGMDSPPSLPKFRKLCLGDDDLSDYPPEFADIIREEQEKTYQERLKHG